jgi:hypothetical protein
VGRRSGENLERGWLREPRRVPERADLSPGLMPRACAAVEALVRQDGQGARSHRQWLRVNPDGFVLNFQIGPRSRYHPPTFFR